MTGPWFRWGVAFDMDLGELTYSVSDSKGEELLSRHGVRPLAQLDVNTLGKVEQSARKYAALRMERQRNIINVESRLSALSKGAGVKM